MGKLAIMSDLHVDINQLGEVELGQLVDVLKDAQVTRLHLAGDTANTVEKLQATVSFIEDGGIPVTYNFGNHEMPGLSTEEMIEAYPDARFLNQTFISLTDKKVLLAFNGWYDYTYARELAFKKIVAAKNLYWYDRFIHRELADPEMHQRILAQLTTVLNQLRDGHQQVIIATHFVPKSEFIVYQKGKYERWNQLNAFLGSDKTGDLFDQYDNIEQVVFGHTHRHFPDEEINGTLYSCRPFGYFYEWRLTRDFVLTNKLMPAFNPLKVRSVLKDHKQAFAAFRQQQLKQEFAESMTLIDY